MDEAIAWAKRLPFEAGGEPEAEGEIEIRQLFELEEFGESPAVEQGRQLERELPKEGVTASDQPSGDRRGLEVDEPVDHRRDAVAEHLAPRAEGLLLVTLTLPRFATEGTAYLPAGRPSALTRFWPTPSRSAPTSGAARRFGRPGRALRWVV